MAKFSIRLKPNSRYQYPIYEVVVLRTRSAPDSRVYEKLGIYYLTRTQRLFLIDLKRLGLWLLRGAALRGTVKKLIQGARSH